MKSLVLILSLLGTNVLAAPSKEMKNRSPDTALSAQKGSEATNYNFEDLLVQGKYNFSDEAVTTVEEDKVLDSLIGVRSDFKDRLKSSTGSY